MQRDGKNLFVIMDGYSCNINCRKIYLLNDNGIIAFGLPDHTRNVLNPLDVGVFGPLKEKFRKILIHRKISKRKETSNGVFTILQLLCKSYHSCVNSRNSIENFRKTGIWNMDKRECEPNVAKETKYTSEEASTATLKKFSQTRSVTLISESSNYKQPKKIVETFEKIFELFKS